MMMSDGKTRMDRVRGLSLASARRQLWRDHHAHSDTWLRAELRKHLYLADPDSPCAPYRSDHLRAVDLWYVRMIGTELRHRMESVGAYERRDNSGGCGPCGGEFCADGTCGTCKSIRKGSRS